MFRLSLIGPGDIDFHFYQLLKFSPKKLHSTLGKIANVLVKTDFSIELLPEKGISLELAKEYRKNGGKEIIGTLPQDDQTFGIEHLQKYLNEEVDGKELFDRTINSGNWFKHDLTKGLFGNAILYLGASPGSDGERNYAVYLYKLMNGFKGGIEITGKQINPEIQAGKNFTIFIYSPFLLGKKLPKEDEIYMKKFGINFVYIQNPNQLEKELTKFSKS